MAAGELTTSLLPRQEHGYPSNGPWGTGLPPWASAWLTCAGHEGYNGCPPFDGGGCCPQGMVCQGDGLCVAGATTSTTATVLCDRGWSACPSSQGGGCCPGGQACGSGVCTAYIPAETTSIGTTVSTITSESVSSQISPNLTALVSNIDVATATVTQLSRTVLATVAMSSDSPGASQTAAASTGESSPAASQAAAASSTGNGLSAAQIGGISAGVVVGFLILAALGWLLVRHLLRISRFMKKFNDHPHEQPAAEGVDGGTADPEMKAFNDGGDSNARQPAELSPQERPQLLDEWGRHGSRGTELAGSAQEAHNISELEGTSLPK